MNRERISELRRTRGDYDFILNFLRNMARVTKNIRTVTNGHPGTATLETKRQFVIGLVSCFETFFRDMFVYYLDNNKSVLDMYWTESHGTLGDSGEAGDPVEISRAELLADTINFQNMHSVDHAFRHIFVGGGTLSQRLSSHKATVSIPSRADNGLAQLALPDDWLDVFDSLLRLRHRLVHDANFAPEIPTKDLGVFELYVLWVAQFFHFVIAQTLVDYQIIVDQNGIPVMLLGEDLVSDDWNLMEEPSAVQAATCQEDDRG